MDIKYVLRNRNLTKDVYMEQPKGFMDPKYLLKVCKLEQAIYGQKQASHSWNLCFHEKVK